MTSISISLIGLFVNGIPEGLLDVLAIFILTKTPFNKRKYLLISFCFITLNYLIRLLPINYGVNTMLGLLVLVLLFTLFMRIDIQKLIKSSIAILIALFTCEQINLFFLFLIFGKEKILELFKDKDVVLIQDTISKALYGIPSTVLFAIIIFIMYLITKKKTVKIDESK